MDLSGAISYNGWSNTLTNGTGGAPADGWEVIEADVSPVGVSQYLDNKALQDGMDAIDVYERARTINLIIGVYGSSEGSFWDNMQTVLSAFNPRIAYNADTANAGFIALKFIQPSAITATWGTSGIPLQFFARPSAPPRYNVNKAATSGVAGKGLSGRVNCSLIARDPRKYEQTAATKNLSAIFPSGPFTYLGDYPTWPTLQVTMAGAGSSAYIIRYGSATVSLDLSGAANNDVYIVDTALRRVTKNGTGVASIINNTTVWEPITAAGTLVHTSNANASLLMTYREAWA